MVSRGLAYFKGFFMKEILLTQGKVALVDDEDFDYLNQWKWTASKHSHTIYAIRDVWQKGQNKGKRIYMHREILETPQDLEVDHKDNNGLNCQRNNIRNCTHCQNQHNQKTSKNNKTGFKGICFNKHARKYMVQLALNGKTIYGGIYANIKEAAIAYNRLAETNHGEFAKLNNLTGGVL
jgi:hypothetical protein